MGSEPSCSGTSPSSPLIVSATGTTEALESNEIAQNRRKEDDFLVTHLQPCPEKVSFDKQELLQLVNAVTSSSNESDMHQPTVKLLNEISKTIHGDQNLPTDQCSFDSLVDSFEGDMMLGHKTRRLLFLDHHHGPPAFHPCGSIAKSDIVGVWGEEIDYAKYRTGDDNCYLDVPCHEVNTIGELKPCPNNAKGGTLTITYLWPLMQARPDMPGFYALYSHLKGYRIIWADTAGPIASPMIEWDNLDPLIAYVYSMYHPPPHHYLYNPTISLTAPEHGFDPANVTYTISVSYPLHNKQEAYSSLSLGDERKIRPTSAGKRVYHHCKPIHWGEMWGRRSMVYSGKPRDNPDSFVVIKDAYRAGREVKIIEHIHADGTVPGVIRLINGIGSTNVQVEGGSLSTAPRTSEAHSGRTLDRLEMRSRGVPFHKAKSLLDLLKATYDVLEVHRFLVLNRGVLHRDISINNVLMYPEHVEGLNGKETFIKDSPKFIDEILQPFRYDNDLLLLLSMF
ncbi:hypothetical protein K474DRAFT_1659067 [Panus rudis PR-1116 ss-1]|nr:hypothetical protein K474DRAFT_1659067 [Panus rudis PR-1116 ss-1]